MITIYYTSLDHKNYINKQYPTKQMTRFPWSKTKTNKQEMLTVVEPKNVFDNSVVVVVVVDDASFPAEK